MTQENSNPLTPATKAKRPAGLGRGLSALLGDVQADSAVPVAVGGAAGNGGAVRDGLALLPIADVRPHPDQPRRHFDDAALDELAASIRTKGLVQPIVVRPAPSGRGWQLVAGERRWRASQRAGLHQIPAIVRDLDDNDTFTIALVENIQRQELTAIEEAEAYARLRDQLGHSQEAIGSMTGKSRSHIANLLRLLDLPESVRALVATGQLGMGHARAMIGHEDAEALARKAVAQGLSVRKVEALVRAARRNRADGRPGGGRATGTLATGSMPDADIAALESHLADLIGVRVRITHEQGRGGGTLSLEYSSLEQLDMLCQRLSGEPI
ncbi:ParB/RepB/Spo0J family partition protein [Sphingomonas lacunae]|uniref:ParB/RepB/Spo0J family partition protein n=1 Tax=Sphingomonas lacunae TaxID=2698828 RepID=A0A6M4AS09_9SPHN|nr:ParB/RepB/Spo0J family partition protein [Sphingomonas lacunae]QJQ31854.1 ParB/RepB/Spo0J family partition protein [Sphingomonas lacunae]